MLKNIRLAPAVSLCMHLNVWLQTAVSCRLPQSMEAVEGTNVDLRNVVLEEVKDLQAKGAILGCQHHQLRKEGHRLRTKGIRV